jgi:SAM-dependent MidA family methyltransferase
MEAALYHPQHGYYRRARDPFGKEGDFYTAEQVQPAFGILMRSVLEALFTESGLRERTVVELGAGRGEMAEAFSSFDYLPVDIGRGALPERFSGIVFSNEFFDALPVDVLVRRGSGFHEMCVDWDGNRFVWLERGPADEEKQEFARRYCAAEEDGDLVEVCLADRHWIERIASSLNSGFVVTVDYGYTKRESIRFPQGTLMSYHRHTAADDVLLDPGGRDITAHVNFTALQDAGTGAGLETARFETLARTLLDAGERDGFAAVLESGTETASVERRLQLKTLLFGMGETFRTLVQRKTGEKQKAPT